MRHVLVTEVREDALALLGLPGHRQVRQELPQRHVQGLPREVEELEVLLTDQLREVVPG